MQQVVVKNTAGAIQFAFVGEHIHWNLSLIHISSKLVEQNMALIGVNLGTLGYLCELEESNVFAAVDELMEEHYTVEKRMMLCGYGIKQSEKTERKVALNDLSLIHISLSDG